MNNKFAKYFWEEPKKLTIHKWHHYFDVYEKHFSRFQETNPIILEVGLYKGGSLEMWNHYFDGKCQIYGIDINPECKQLENHFNNVKIFIGDQGDPAFWSKIKLDVPKLDIFIDDGSHQNKDQIIAYEHMYEHIKDDGVFLCEDTHTSYWSSHQGGLRVPNTFMEYSKNFIDQINAYHVANITDPNLAFRKSTHSVHFYDSIVVLEKRKDLVPPTHTQRN